MAIELLILWNNGSSSGGSGDGSSSGSPAGEGSGGGTGGDYHQIVDLIMENQVFLEKVEEIHQYLIQK